MTRVGCALLAGLVLLSASCGGGEGRESGERSVDTIAVDPSTVIPDTASSTQRNLMTAGEGRTPVTFRHDAPGADVVRLEFTGNYWNVGPDSAVELIRVDDAISSHALTLQLGDDQWLYRYRVDGRWVTDDFATEQVGAENAMFNSLVRVGDRLPDSVPVAASQAGTVETIEVDSDLLGRAVPYVLYTPPNRSDRALPVLVLLHGFGQPATDWAEAVGIGHFMDNLLADRRIEPFAIVMPSGENSSYAGNRALHIVDEVIPDARARLGLAATVDRAAPMAVGGFSQGGAGALRLTDLRPDDFGLTMPIAMAGPCGGRCATSLYDETYPDGFTSEFAMWVGVHDELGLDVEHDRFVAYASSRDIQVTDVRSRSDGHRWNGHSIRYVRTIAPDVLLRASEFFSS